MVKALTFKGDKKTKKRKRVDVAEKFGDDEGSTSKEVLKTEKEDPSVDDDSWVTAETLGDVVGPIVIVMPSEPPTCIACDTNGKVFASLLENIVEDNPATAEPHDVRQVWIANKVAGTETFSFKGHHGKSVHQQAPNLRILLTTLIGI
jgi:protein FRG1